MKSSSKYQSLETRKEEVNLLIVFYAYFVLLPPIDKHLSFNLGVDARKWPIAWFLKCLVECVSFNFKQLICRIVSPFENNSLSMS